MESEIRSLKAELRAKPGFKLEGTAARFGTRSHDLGGFIETIQPGAFKRSIESGAKIIATLNHDPNQVLGSTKAGTAKVWEDADGLQFSVQLDPTSTVHMNAYASVKRGDIDSCSFAFRVPAGGDSFSQTKDGKGHPIPLRTLKDVDLVDVSAVTYPAYPEGTQVDARSLEAKGLLRVAVRGATTARVTKKPVPSRPFTEEELAQINGCTVAQFRERADYDRLFRARALGKQIQASDDADRRARAAKQATQLAADAAQTAKDDELRNRMAHAAGHTHHYHRTHRG